MKLLANTKSNIAEDENSENVSHSKITDRVLVHCNTANNYYQYILRILYDFVPNKLFGLFQLLDILPSKSIFLKIFNWEFSYNEVWFTDQNSKPLEIDDQINITLVIN